MTIIDKKWIIAWLLLAMIATISAFLFFQGDFPIFVLLNLIISSIIIIRNDDLSTTYIKPLQKEKLANYAIINTTGILLIYLILEPFFGLYKRLLELSIEDGVDITFGWIVKFPNVSGWLILLLFSAFVTLFSEEVLFRSILLPALERRYSQTVAILLQALIFSIPQSIILFVFPLLDGVLFILFYSIIAIGSLGAYMTSKSGSVFPTLIAVTISNFIMAILYLS